MSAKPTKQDVAAGMSLPRPPKRTAVPDDEAARFVGETTNAPGATSKRKRPDRASG